MRNPTRAWRLALVLVVAVTTAGYASPQGKAQSSTTPGMLQDNDAVRRMAVAEAAPAKPLPIPDEPGPFEPVASLSDLLNADRDQVQLHDLDDPEREKAVRTAVATKDFVLLREQLAREKFELDMGSAKVVEARFSRMALSIVIVSVPGRGPADDVQANVTVATASDGTSLVVGHITNLGTAFEVRQTGYPVFYVRWWIPLQGRLVYWRYWWYDSHNHPNWFYSCYYWYWRYWWYYRGPWPYWYTWFWGWYYGSHWYYWSTWFPW